MNQQIITASDTSATTNPKDGITAKSWFNSGERLAYDAGARRILTSAEAATANHPLYVFSRYVSTGESGNETPITFLPGFPDGSIGWTKTDALLAKQGSPARLFVEYVGQGDSDKPESYSYSTRERADLVEAIWQARGIKSTYVVTFDYSSLVVMELLVRQRERQQQGITPTTIITQVLLINGGYFVDGHSHPWMTTPLLKTSFGKMSTRMAQRSPFMFNQMIKGMWSKEYGVTHAELGEVFDAITRRNGAVFLHNAARFVDEHKANAARWDLLNIVQTMHDSVTFAIVGSEKDQFEPRQVTLAKERLAPYGVDIRLIPGGHMITSEHPDLLAEIILELNRKAKSRAY